MKNCLTGDDSRAGTLETVLASLVENADKKAVTRRVFAELRITGLARFLSHAELLRGLERACVRAGIDLHYSQGFNPRPQMSLPLPKSVGVESTGDVLCLRLGENTPVADEDSARQDIQDRLAAELPQGVRLLTLRLTTRRCSLQPRSARWTLPLSASAGADALKTRVDRLLASDSVLVLRSQPSKPHKTKRKNIRQYISSIEILPSQLRVDYRITPEGSVRLDEVLSLLGLDQTDLAGPIQRSHIRWQAL